MSLMGTLAKIAIGVAVAKGVGGMLKSGKTAPSGQGGGGLLGDLLKGAQGQTQQQQSRDQQIGGQGGLGDLLGQVLGGQQGGRQPQGGGLGDLLEQLGGGLPSGNQQTGGAGGGLGDLLGQLTGGNATSGNGGAGGLGDLLGGLVGGAAQQGGASGNGGSFGDILNQAFQKGEPEVQPSPDQEAVAALMLRAMVQATKADGELDNDEKERLLSNLGDVSEEERAFVHNELQAPSDIQGLAAQVPQGMQQQIYMMSVMAIDLDSQAEAQYLHQFASAMGMGQDQVNAIHDQLGVQRLYA